MNKLSKVCKRDPKAVQDRDKAIRSQFAENVREPWLKRDLKKRLRDHPDLAFNDIREEATLLVQDADASFTVKPNIKVERDIPDISIFAEQATSNTLELTKAVADLTQEVSNLKVEINNLKSSGDTRQGTKPPPRCYNCNKIGHIKRNCRSERRTENGLNKNSLLPGARECPTVEIEIGGNKLNCLLDTGSMVSTITEKFFRENLMNKYELYESTKYLKLRAANGLDIPYIGYIETDIFVPSLKKTIEDRGILIVKDVHDSNDNISGILGMNVVNQCMGLLQSEIGPLYIKELKKMRQ
ncbi:unnamed protein product [Mytilus coruscus]|uniref:CCHC-type domain-containing protein n=1 Tax=Mytilus coruscus TaxID=42192 RepID=A0A6J8CL96_MYTCO|nr:unnamed protein product [Mytilus coruscus]